MEDLEKELREVKAKAKKDNDFMQDALQKRFDQMEEWQEKAESLENTVQQHLAQITIKEKEVTREQAKYKELEELLKETKAELDLSRASEYSKDIVDKQRKEMNSKAEENFNLKNIIEAKRKEGEKNLKKLVALEDQHQVKMQELDTINRDFKETKNKLSMQIKFDNEL